MGRRSHTDLSFVLGIDKPSGPSSHDVVNAVRRIYGEGRVGHCGTLDPAASGVLAVCVGPAARLGNYLSGHDKSYLFTIEFGSATDTDDAQGEVVREADVPKEVYDEGFARRYLASLVGVHQQLPPVYSAVKVAGTKSYEAARKGKVIDLSPREIEVYDAQLIGLQSHGGAHVSWLVAARVSAGTYVRSLARDTGAALGTLAHVGQLRRTSSGKLHSEDCVSLEVLEERPFACALDPVRLLGYRIVFASDELAAKVDNGAALPSESCRFFAYDQVGTARELCACTSGLAPSPQALADGELVSVVRDNKLKAIYKFDESAQALRCACAFSIGVSRGFDI